MSSFYLQKPHIVQLTVDVKIANAMLVPIVLGFLLALEARALPGRYRCAQHIALWYGACAALLWP